MEVNVGIFLQSISALLFSFFNTVMRILIAIENYCTVPLRIGNRQKLNNCLAYNWYSGSDVPNNFMDKEMFIDNQVKVRLVARLSRTWSKDFRVFLILIKRARGTSADSYCEYLCKSSSFCFLMEFFGRTRGVSRTLSRIDDDIPEMELPPFSPLLLSQLELH